MPYALIQEIDAHFHAIDKWKAYMQSALQFAHIATRLGRARRAGAAPTALENSAQNFVTKAEDGYSRSAGTIYGYLHAPVIAAIGARLADALVGPLGWPHTVAIVSIAATVDLVRLKRLRHPTLISIAVSVMPRAVSGSFTSLVGAAFCLYSLGPPLVLYARNDISDRTEVRLIIIGLLVDGLYLCTAIVLGPIQLTSAQSLARAAAVSLAAFALLYVVGTAMFNSGPWDPYFKLKYVGNTGRVVQHPLSLVVEASIRFFAQLVVFRLNRIVRFLVRLVVYLEPSVSQEIRADSDNAYQYNVIQGEGSIRLLRVLKGRFHQRVRCEFVDYRLGGSESYEAISYVWGSGVPDSTILLGGRPLEITRSAFNIIRKRRSMWEDKLIWIDQVCINQKDDGVEKTAQVKMMSRIYKEAALVTAYLGDSSSSYYIQLLFATLHFLMHGLGVPAKAMAVIYILTFRIWQSEAVGEFFGNQWFRRVWIIQEAALASHLHIIYGDICMDWEYLSRAMDALGHREMLGALHPSSTHESLLAYTLGVRNVDPILELRGDIKRSRRFDLARVLTLGNGFKSTDPRDKVYALLGMTRDGARDSIEPDYRLDRSPQDVYRDAMLFILAKNDDPLRLLVGAGIGFERSLADLPSWIPDWSHDTHLQIIDAMYSAAGRSKPIYSVVSTSRGVISLDGVVFDEIRYVGQQNGRIDEHRDSFDILRWCFSAEQASLLHTRKPYANEEDRKEAFIRTLLGNHDSYDKRAKLGRDECLEYYRVARTSYEIWDARGGQDALAPALPSSSNPQGGTDSLNSFLGTAATRETFLHFSLRSTQTMSFCVTEQDRMAIVPPLSRPGDLICLIKGARRPYVLRRASPPEKPLEYTLVGCCYVQGVMDGEMVGRLEDSVPLVLV